MDHDQLTGTCQGEFLQLIQLYPDHAYLRIRWRDHKRETLSGFGFEIHSWPWTFPPSTDPCRIGARYANKKFHMVEIANLWTYGKKSLAPCFSQKRIDPQYDQDTNPEIVLCLTHTRSQYDVTNQSFCAWITFKVLAGKPISCLKRLDVDGLPKSLTPASRASKPKDL